MSRRLFVFGGKYYERSDCSPSFSGLYSYDLTRKVWSHHTPDVDPASVNWLQEHKAIPSRTGHSMLCDTANRRILILAGQRSDQYLSDLWSYSLEDGRIECLDRDYGLHGGPDGGFTQRAVIDDSRREFVLLSGLMKEKVPPHFTQVKVRPSALCQWIVLTWVCYMTHRTLFGCFLWNPEDGKRSALVYRQPPQSQQATLNPASHISSCTTLTKMNIM